MLALDDGPAFVAAFFGVLKVGAVVVMTNPGLKQDAVADLYDYTRARLVVADAQSAATYRAAMEGQRFPEGIMVVGEDFDPETSELPDRFDTFPTHADDPAIWLFSGGTTGRPKAVVQPHRSFANTAELYGRGVLGIGPDAVTLSVPKLFFGYATGTNLMFPFRVGGSCVLFPERSTAERLLELIAEHRPTILINVPTMVSKMVAAASDGDDLSCLRLSTSAGEALPVELYQRWRERFGVELLDGLGTAEMWHVFVSNRPGAVKPGTLGQVVEGFELRVCDDEGQELPAGETGWLWVKGGSRAIAYWQLQDASEHAFRGSWYVSGDMIRRDVEGYVTYCGRGDDMLKVAGKWLAPAEVEGCLLEHPSVAHCAGVGVVDDAGLTKPHAFVVLKTGEEEAPAEADLAAFVRERLDHYKVPRAFHLRGELPQTHLGKVDRGALRRAAGSKAG